MTRASGSIWGAHRPFIVAPAELKTVPPCQYCARIPQNGYHRYNDGTVACADSRECFKRDISAMVQQCAP